MQIKKIINKTDGYIKIVTTGNLWPNCNIKHIKHLTGIDQPCEIHAAITSGQRQVVMNLCKLQAAIRKGSNRAVKAKVNLPAIRIDGIGGERPIVPISLFTAMELSTLIQGAGEVQEADVEHLPYYIQRLKEKVIDFMQTLD